MFALIYIFVNLIPLLEVYIFGKNVSYVFGIFLIDSFLFGIVTCMQLTKIRVNSHNPENTFEFTPLMFAAYYFVIIGVNGMLMFALSGASFPSFSEIGIALTFFILFNIYIYKYEFLSHQLYEHTTKEQCLVTAILRVVIIAGTMLIGGCYVIIADVEKGDLPMAVLISMISIKIILELISYVRDTLNLEKKSKNTL